jgi:hypothetical protein
MLYRPIEQSHHVIMACPTVIVEHHQPIPGTDESRPFTEATIQWHLLRQELGKSSFRLVRVIKTAATACQWQRGHKTAPIAVLEAMLQPAGRVGNTIACIHQDCNVSDWSVTRIIEWHVAPLGQMTSRSYVGDKMVEIHKLATFHRLEAAGWGAAFNLWFSGPAGAPMELADRRSAIGLQQTAHGRHKVG